MFRQLFQPAGQRRRCGFIDNAFHGKPRQLTGLPRGLALRVIEISRHRDHRAVNALLECLFRLLLEGAQNIGRHFFGGNPPTAQIHRQRFTADGIVDRTIRGAPTHEALDGINCARRLQNPNALRGPADRGWAILGVMHDRGHQPVPLGIGQQPRDARFHHGDGGVGRTQVYAYNAAHARSLQC